MKINRPEIVNLVHRLYKQEQSHSKTSSAKNINILRSDSLEISAGSEMLKKEFSRLAKSDSSRQARIEELTRQVETGEYSVDSRKLAEALFKYMEAGADESHDG